MPISTRILAGSIALALFGSGIPAGLAAETEQQDTAKRRVFADVAAIDQAIVYNRFGSFNPFGMVFALRRDLSPAEQPPAADFDGTADYCRGLTGAEAGTGWMDVSPGNARLKDCKRPRPLVLRANVGDILHVRVTNLLDPDIPNFSDTFCRTDAPAGTVRHTARKLVSQGGRQAVETGLASCRTDGSTDPEAGAAGDWPATRSLSFAIQGLTAVDSDGRAGRDGIDPVCLGLAAIAPGESRDCYFAPDQEGTFFFASTAAPSGGEGDGGSITHGLFGAVMVEPKGSAWFRSQVSEAGFERAWPGAAGVPHARKDQIDYHAFDGDAPILDLVRAVDDQGRPLPPGPSAGAMNVEIVHGDLNAIIVPPAGHVPSSEPFREFSVFFHDELKTFYARNFEELGQFGQLAGVRDGFAINYGASGMGAMLLANRKGIGPAANCVECLYEEFFLTSWANGDPALLEFYADDPSNVHHSYLNDAIVFRNLHAGPKETHVFHLHAHQWFAGNDDNRGSYLDSQTVAPQQAFSYRVFHSPIETYLTAPEEAPEGWWETLGGSGNRNRTVGDSIFHCHLYPHFAQGMWELWRSHDVLEDGSRRLPDGQASPGFSVALRDPAEARSVRPGSVDANGVFTRNAPGTPIPAVVPLPGRPLPLLPTYSGVRDTAEGQISTVDSASGPETATPGYPFFVGGRPGHRPPQPPLDIAQDGDRLMDGGLGRHVVTDGERVFGIGPLPPDTPDSSTTAKEAIRAQAVAKMVALGDMSAKFKHLSIDDLEQNGNALERAAMGFHADGKSHVSGAPLDLRGADGNSVAARGGGYATVLAPTISAPSATPSPAVFAVNGAAPKPGAPFADPCAAPWAARGIRLRIGQNGGSPLAAGRTLDAIPDPLFGGQDLVPDPGLIGFRRYEVSAVQVDLVTNGAGWHDPQGRINVLTADSDAYKSGGGRISPRISAEEQPFFFRALSGECIEFRHTNELPKELELDDFQVRTPTDTIGQHIHLVKFDVTASDGSGNGWNYEDGTFAPDELASRLCAAGRDPSRCHGDAPAGEWRLKRSAHRDLFQTTVQRWFADPILAPAVGCRTDETPADCRKRQQDNLADRTMRSVFTHDHFGPSSIQQHGFYAALLIEPYSATVCDVETDGDCTAPRVQNGTLVNTGLIQMQGPDDKAFRANVGTRKRILALPGRADLESDTNYREFALAIADFATLYDPRDRDQADALCEAAGLPGMMRTAQCRQQAGGRLAPKREIAMEGMALLACEARLRASPAWLNDVCGSGLEKDGELGWISEGEDRSPAWVAHGLPGMASLPGEAPSRARLITSAEAAALLDHVIDYRRKAAGNRSDRQMARPVAAPRRPESISVDHHDPYLVNYRGEPAPLRLGTRADSRGNPIESGCDLRDPNQRARELENGGISENCSVSAQRSGERGDVANLFRSTRPADGAGARPVNIHGDPSTPILESYANDRVMIRLIQGAQEVQHTFTMDGRMWLRNIDQHFPQGERIGAYSHAGPTLQRACADAAVARNSEPVALTRLIRSGVSPNTGDPQSIAREQADREYLKLLEACQNVQGFTEAQEIGISEHFEFSAPFRTKGLGLESVAGAAGSDPTRDVVEGSVLVDSLYHFGSNDAIWNGAWGLLRVYESPGTPDPLAASDVAIGDRLAELPKSSQTESATAAEPSAPTQVPAALLCKPDAPQVYAAIAAVRYADLYGKPMPLGGTLQDPDGLFLALLDPTYLGLEGWSDRDGWRALWHDIPRETVRNALLRADPDGSAIAPLSLNVQAGDCVELAIVNLLGDGRETLPDGYGDAALPRITPLNVGAQTSADEGDPLRVTLAAEWGSREAFGLNPSSRLALRFPLPILDEAAQLPLPFGRNPTSALAPGRAMLTADRDRAPNISLQGFYAGRVSLEIEPADVAIELASQVLQGLPPPFTLISDLGLADPNDGSTPLNCVPDQRLGLRMLGVSLYPVCTGDLGPADRAALTAAWPNLVAATDRALPGFLTDKANWVPYAYGPVAIRSYGDVFDHGPHGLVGAVNVMPTSFGAYPGRAPLDGVTGAFVLRPQPATMRGMQVTLDPSRLPDEVADKMTARELREYVLFWRDGMNVWDVATANRWRDRNGRLNSTVRMVQDCMICDDSYDRGEAAIGYLSPAFANVLRSQGVTSPRQPEQQDNLNLWVFPNDFFLAAADKGLMPVLEARQGEELVIHVVHPGGRARQRAFTTFGLGYDDLFPGFGFPNAALVAPGKTVRAALSAPAQPGCYLFGDGPLQIRARGVWGLLDVRGADDRSQCHVP